MTTSQDSSTEHHRRFGIGPTDDNDIPPTASMAGVSLATRSAASENAIKNHVLIAFSLSLIPIPVFDFAMLTANQVKMVHTLGRIHGEQSFRDSRIKAIVLSLVSGALPVLSVQGLSSGLKGMPGIGSLAGSAGVAVSGGLLTYAIGRVFTKHFESGGTYVSFDIKQAREQLKKEIERGRGVVSNLKKKAQRPQPGTV